MRTLVTGAARSRGPHPRSGAEEEIREIPAARIPPRVLFVSDHLGLPGGSTDGATTYFNTVLPPLASTDIDLTVCFLRERHPAADALEHSGVTLRFLSRGKWDPLAFFDLWRIIRDRDIEVVHAAGMKGILLARLAARMEGRKTIIHLHDLNPLGLVLGVLHRGTARWTDRALAVSRAVGELASDDFGVSPERVRVLHNGIRVERFPRSGVVRKAVREELGYTAASRVIGIVGRLASDKGHLVLLDALPSVVREVPNAVLLIVGEGPLRMEIERRAAALGIDARVRFTGFRMDIPELLSAMDLVVMPSRKEGLGFSALEAMAARRPLVATSTGGLAELVDHEVSGLLVEPDDDAGIARALVRVLEDPCLGERLVRGGMERLESFGVDRHVEALVDEYYRLARGGGADSVSGDEAPGSNLADAVAGASLFSPSGSVSSSESSPPGAGA